MEYAERDIRYIRSWRDKTLYRIGNAYFTHGQYHGLNHAKKMVDTYCSNIFYGHTHDVSLSPKAMHGKDKVVVGQSLGCQCKADLSYIMHNPKNWQPAFGIFYFFPNGDFTYYVPRIIGGQFISPDGKTYRG
jgi:hypothetical protein